jgi:hypothetical protein
MRALILTAVLLGAAASARALDIVHEPIGCVPAGRYARVIARSEPALAATAAEAQFRTGPDAGWYRVRMEGREGEWQAFLPRPTSALARFEYRVVLFGADATTRETAPVAVRVAAPREGCGPGETSATAAAMVLQVPPGAPAFPPVPLGFSPVGAGAPEGARRLAPPRAKGGRGLAIAGGVAGVAGATAVAASGAKNDAIAPQPDDPSQQLPGFTFTGIVPPPSPTVALGRDTFGVIVTMDREPAEPLPVQFTVGLQTLVNSTRCANVTGTFQGAQRPLGLVLTGPVVLAAGAPCGESFDVGALFLLIRARDRVVIQGTVPLQTRLRVEP